MTPEDRANAIVGAFGMKLPDLYREVKEFAAEMIRVAVAEEREACAAIAESYHGNERWYDVRVIADAIRSRRTP